jgi:hypothetical protein
LVSLKATSSRSQSRTTAGCSRTCPRPASGGRAAPIYFSGRLKRRCNGVRLNDVPVTIAFTPGESLAVLKEIVGAVAAARDRLYVASVVLSSGPVLAALSEAIDRGLPLGGLYYGPQMDQVERQRKAANVGTDVRDSWESTARAWIISRPDPGGPMGKREAQIILKTDERTIVLELGTRGNSLPSQGLGMKTGFFSRATSLT